MKASKNRKYVCSVCRKKMQLSPFQMAEAYTDDFESCFGIRTAIDKYDKVICEGCRRTVKSFHYVIADSSYSSTFCLSLSANAFL